jgi:oxepin-CoA hydrolase/3-oxo-5,6-dehydrosuberyl-CoA semialdehyde dehydrogenase
VQFSGSLKGYRTALVENLQRTCGRPRAFVTIVGCAPFPNQRICITMHAPVLQSLIANRWVGTTPASLLRSAIDGSAVAHTHAEVIDFAEAVHHARTVGVPALLKLDFQQRAALLKALAAYLLERKEALYTLSRHSGATRADSWIDIEGGTGTLFAYAGVGAGDLPSGNVVHEVPAMPLGKTGVFAGTHILVPRRGVAVHINAFNFPIWGLLEKFAPAFLAGMPCIGKPATATSWLTEAAVRMMNDSGLLPPGSLQLVIGGTGDLLDRLTETDVVTFTGSADTAARLRVHPNLVARSIPFNAEADSLNCAVLADDVGPDDEAFELFVKEVAREMTVKAGQKCTANRRAIVEREDTSAALHERDERDDALADVGAVLREAVEEERKMTISDISAVVRAMPGDNTRMADTILMMALTPAKENDDGGPQ